MGCSKAGCMAEYSVIFLPDYEHVGHINIKQHKATVTSSAAKSWKKCAFDDSERKKE